VWQDVPDLLQRLMWAMTNPKAVAQGLKCRSLLVPRV
jgi:hypothetical protein